MRRPYLYMRTPYALIIHIPISAASYLYKKKYVILFPNTIIRCKRMHKNVSQWAETFGALSSECLSLIINDFKVIKFWYCYNTLLHFITKGYLISYEKYFCFSHIQNKIQKVCIFPYRNDMCTYSFDSISDRHSYIAYIINWHISWHNYNIIDFLQCLS